MTRGVAEDDGGWPFGPQSNGFGDWRHISCFAFKGEVPGFIVIGSGGFAWGDGVVVTCVSDGNPREGLGGCGSVGACQGRGSACSSGNLREP